MDTCLKHLSHHLRIHSNPDNQFDNISNKEVKTEDHNAQRTPSETCGGDKQDSSLTVNGVLNRTERNSEAMPADEMDEYPLDAYKHAAPRLLKELSWLLLQYKWAEEGCIPHGLVNILSYSWRDLTAGAVYLKPRKSKGSLSLDETLGQMVVNDKKKTDQINSAVVVNSGQERTTQLHSNLRRKRSLLSNAHRG